MHFDVIIIGAGMSGLAAGIRLALFDKRVCIVEKHYAYGGLNSYYTLEGRQFDVGLHALTNYVPPGTRSAPLLKLLRQLRLSRDELELCEQRGSEIRFPGRTLRFTNDIGVLTGEIAREFPSDGDNFVKFLARIRDIEYGSVGEQPQSVRSVLGEAFRDPVLMEMLLCPVMYYGSPSEHDMEFSDFATIFKSIFCEGLARPRKGILGLLKPLVRKFRTCGGKLRMQCGVERIDVRGGVVDGVTLQTGESLTADVVLSSAGWHETMRLCGAAATEDTCGIGSGGESETATAHGAVGHPAVAHPAHPEATAHPEARAAADRDRIHEGAIGRLSFVESFLCLERPPAELGMDQTVIFFNDADTFSYSCPDEPADLRSGVVCCPNNYERHDHLREGLFRLTWLANYEHWSSLGPEAYASRKQQYLEEAFKRAAVYVPEVREHVVFTDMFTPRTIEAFTGHRNGAVYGSPHKCRDGRTPIANLFLCGTDQGLVGIVGALMSGVTMANRHILAGE